MRSALHPVNPTSAAPARAAVAAIMNLRKPAASRVPHNPELDLTAGTEHIDMALDIVIMAAGKGTRMKSSVPKVLHRLAGRSLLQHVLQTAATLGAQRIVTITGHGAELVEAAVAAPGLRFVRQIPQLGTGHAMQQAAPELQDNGTTL